MRRAVYSALMGAYELPVMQDVVFPNDVDKFLFTDRPERVERPGWQVVEVAPRYTDSVRSARYLKIVGHPRLLDYDQTIWIDNRVQLKGRAMDLFDLVRNHDLALPKHSFRGSIVEEFEEVLRSGYDDPSRVRLALAMMRASGVPDRSQPLWTGVIVRKNRPEVQACMQYWLELLLLGSRRDQLSILTAIANYNVAVNSFDLDNLESEFHRWVPLGEMGRARSTQIWSPSREALSVRIGDRLRSRPAGQRAARILDRFGVGPRVL